MVFKMMCFKVFSKFLMGFNVFQNCVFQSVFKIPHRFQWFSKLCVSKCFQKFPIGFNGFQNYVFQ